MLQKPCLAWRVSLVCTLACTHAHQHARPPCRRRLMPSRHSFVSSSVNMAAKIALERCWDTIASYLALQSSYSADAAAQGACDARVR